MPKPVSPPWGQCLLTLAVAPRDLLFSLQARALSTLLSNSVCQNAFYVRICLLLWMSPTDFQSNFFLFFNCRVFVEGIGDTGEQQGSFPGSLKIFPMDDDWGSSKLQVSHPQGKEDCEGIRGPWCPKDIVTCLGVNSQLQPVKCPSQGSCAFFSKLGIQVLGSHSFRA